MNPLIALVKSRKFYLFLIGLSGTLAMYMTDTITPEQFNNNIIWLTGILTGSIALEDAAQKLSMIKIGDVIQIATELINELKAKKE